MKILISGICGFVGSRLARALRESSDNFEVVGFDSLVRPGSELNRRLLRRSDIRVIHADMRCCSDVEALPRCDWVIDAAANPSVVAGMDGSSSSRQLVEHNLGATINLLEYCKLHEVGLTLLSTSRVYSIAPLCDLRFSVEDSAFLPTPGQQFPAGVSTRGVSETFSTAAPVSLYGATKLASEALALEYGEMFGFPVWINRCGVLAGAGQFGRPDQGIFSYWIHSWLQKKPLRYIGFGGVGHQVRDCLHPVDLLPVLTAQMSESANSTKPRIANFAGGVENSMSLAQLSAWCKNRFGPLDVGSQPESRSFDVPWLVLDAALARETWGWKPAVGIRDVLTEIADHAEENPDWLEISAP